MFKNTEKKIDTRYPFLNIETLTVLFCLLFKKGSMQTAKFIYAGKYDINYNFLKDLQKFPEYKLEEIINFTEFDDYFEFALVKEKEESLIKFLQDYINLYKSGKLKSADIYSGKKVNYYTYEQNLIYAQKVVEYYLEKYGYDFSINIGDICYPEFEHPQCNINMRFLEVIIEIYLQKIIYKKYFKINTFKVLLTNNFLNKRIFLDMDIILSETYYKIFEKLKEGANIQKVQQKKVTAPKVYTKKELIEGINLKDSIKKALEFALAHNKNDFDIEDFRDHYDKKYKTEKKAISHDKYLYAANRELNKFLLTKKQDYIFPKKDENNRKTDFWGVDIPVK